MGFDAPRSATAIPLKPFAAMTEIGSYVMELPAIVDGARMANAPPSPASIPARDIVSMMLRLLFIPAYSAASLLKPVARSS